MIDGRTTFMMPSTDECRLYATSIFHFTEMDYKQYIATADYMSKRKRLRALLVFLICSLLFVIPFLWSISVSSSRGYVLLLIILFLIPSPAIIISNIKKQPPWWGWGYQVNQLTEMYSEALGFPPNESEKEYCFEVYDDSIQFITSGRTTRASYEDIRWVEKKGDLVIIGYLDGAKSLLNPFFAGNEPHYKAVPAMAFHASKLEGMDSDELIAILEEYAKKPKRPVTRKDAWK